MTALVALLSILAVWRVTHMLQDEEGPFGVFYRLEALIAKLPNKVGGIYSGFHCFYCLSMWVALPFAAILAPWPNGITEFIIYWFSLSAGAVFINLVHSKLEQ